MRKTPALTIVALLLVAGWTSVAGAKERGQKGKAAVHVDIAAIGRDGQTRILAIDRGEITAASPASVTLKRPDGKSVSLVVDAQTIVAGRGGKLALDALQPGAKVAASSTSGKAFLIVCRCGERAAGPPAGPPAGNPKQRGPKGPNPLRGAVHADISEIHADGSTDAHAFDRGEITAIGAGSVTLKRPDGKSVTLKTDAKTVVREKGKTVGLGDLEAGDRAMVLSRAGTAFLIRCVRPAK